MGREFVVSVLALFLIILLPITSFPVSLLADNPLSKVRFENLSRVTTLSPFIRIIKLPVLLLALVPSLKSFPSLSKKTLSTPFFFSWRVAFVLSITRSLYPLMSPATAINPPAIKSPFAYSAPAVALPDAVTEDATITFSVVCMFPFTSNFCCGNERPIPMLSAILYKTALVLDCTQKSLLII